MISRTIIISTLLYFPSGTPLLGHTKHNSLTLTTSAPSTVTALLGNKLPVLISEFMGYAIETIHLVM
jgi:hypothetical protein